MSRPGGGDDALRSFMHQLGMMEGMFGHGPSRDTFAKIAERLQPSVPPHEKISALNELSEAFLMGTEITLRGFDSASFASLIVPCLDVSCGNAVVNSALLAIFNIMETIPQHLPAFVSGGCIRPIVAILENVEFIDTHEQAVSVLNKLAPEHSMDIASCGGLCAVLTYLDFFDAATQRSLANIAAQLGKAVAANTPSSRTQFLPQFMQVLPVLTSMMSSSMAPLHTAGHQCMSTLLMCISDSTSRDSLQSFIGAGALSLLLHSVAAHFYVAPATAEPRDRVPVAASPASSASEPASNRRESLGAAAAGGSVRLSDSLVHTILLALQHVATMKHGQQLLLANSIESVLADFFLGHEFCHDASSSSFAPSIINQRSPTHTLSMCKFLSSLLPPIDAAFRDLLMPVIVATAGDDDISAIFTSTSSQDVPAEERAQLLGLLPPLICSVCAAGTASSNTSLTLACAQLLLFSCNSAQSTSALLAQLQPSVISALASFLSHSSMSVCGLSAITCQLIVKRCQNEGAQLLQNMGIPGELEDAIERWRGCRLDKSVATSPKVCDKLIGVLEAALQNINVLCESSSLSPQDTANVVQQLRKSRQYVDVAALRSLFIGPRALSALQLLKSGLPLALSQFLCAENDYPRPSAQYQSDRLVWFFQQLSSCTDSPDGMQDVTRKTPVINSEICRVFLSEIVMLLIDGMSSKEQVTAVEICIHIRFPSANEHYDGNFTAALRQLAQPVKLKLQALSSAASPASQDSAVGTVGIESLAPLHIVDNFIYERLNPSAAQVGPAGAAAAKSHKYNLYLNGVPLEHGMPIIRAITTSLSPSSFPTRTMSGSGSRSGGASAHPYDAKHPTWSQVHTVHFEPRHEQADSEAADPSSEACRLTFLDYDLAMTSACKVECSPDISGALSLLQTVYKISQSFFALLQYAEAVNSGCAASIISSAGAAPPLLRNEQFVCEKLRLKIMRQISDPIVVCSRDFPQWLAVIGQEFQFLLPCECRSAMLHAMSFNVYRSLHALVTKHTDANSDVRVSRIPRQQVRVSRTRIISCARKIVEQLGYVSAMVEIEFYGEVGTGLGPTLEFYSTLALELQAVSLNMWRCPATVTRAELFPDGLGQAPGFGSEPDGGVDDPVSNEFVHSPCGLFPPPMQPDSAACSAAAANFLFLGKLLARCMMDGRLFDLPLSPLIYKVLCGQSLVPDDVYFIDPELHSRLCKFSAIAVAHAQALEMCDAFDRSSLLFNDCPIDELGLTMTVPGYDDLEMVPAGSGINVTLDNLLEYVSAVRRWTLHTGVSSQLESLLRGFNSFLPLSALLWLNPSELENMLRGQVPSFSMTDLMACLKPNHGYGIDSAPFVWLLEVLQDMNEPERRLFLRFLTGNPTLPAGGLHGLKPSITVVRRESDNSSISSDEYLPSVMTCVNYLKLPPYSTREVLASKLHAAMRQGQAAFHLS